MFATTEEFAEDTNRFAQNSAVTSTAEFGTRSAELRASLGPGLRKTSVLHSTTLDTAEHGSPNARDSQRILAARRDTEPAALEALAGVGLKPSSIAQALESGWRTEEKDV